MIVSWKAFCRSLIIQRCERDGRTPGKQNIWMASWRRSYLKDCFSFFSLRWVTFALQLCDHCFFFFTMQPKKEKHCSHSVEWNRGENHLRDMSSAGRRLWSQQLITLHHLFLLYVPDKVKNTSCVITASLTFATFCSYRQNQPPKRTRVTLVQCLFVKNLTGFYYFVWISLFSTKLCVHAGASVCRLHPSKPPACWL